MDILVGTYTGNGSEGIYHMSFDLDDGMLSEKRLLAKVDDPSFIAFDDEKKLLFSVSESDTGRLLSFKWDAGDKEVQYVDQILSGGAYPCYIGFDNGKVSLANYGSGNTLVGSVVDGKFEDLKTFQHNGTLGSDQDRQEAPHGHFSNFGDGFIYSVDLGIDEVIAIPNDEESGLGEMKTALKLESGDGPRHLDFHPNLDMVVVVNELSNTLVSARINYDSGTFKVIDRISILPSDYNEASQAADVHFSPDGKFVYASNRGHNSIAIISFDENGKMELLGTEDVRGNWPRNFMITPDGKWIIVANQYSSNITVFSRNLDTGMLIFTGKEVEVFDPTCLLY